MALFQGHVDCRNFTLNWPSITEMDCDPFTVRPHVGSKVVVSPCVVIPVNCRSS